MTRMSPHFTQAAEAIPAESQLDERMKVVSWLTCLVVVITMSAGIECEAI